MGEHKEQETRAPKRTAAGLPAVANALKFASTQMGPVRAAKALKVLNQPDGVDCPGCAWPESSHRHLAEFCENGARAVAEEATKQRADAKFFADHSIAQLQQLSGYELGRAGRITEPMFKAADSEHYRPISWSDAFAKIAAALQGVDSPDEAVFYTSGRTSNEAAFLYQLFVRKFGTNNLPDCSNLCHESSGVALIQTIGIGKGSVLLEDFEKTDLIFVVGQNPGTNHPRMLSTLSVAKRNGAKIISVNPLPEAGLLGFRNPQSPAGLAGVSQPLTDQLLQIRLNGDLALFQALNYRLIARDAVDHDFISQYCNGWPTFRAANQLLDWSQVLAATGLTTAEIDEVVEAVINAKSVIVCWAMGLTQHKNSVATIREIVNFLLLRGNIGRPGAGVCPVRGHSNVQGDRTMGIVERPSPQLLEALRDRFDFAPPIDEGYDVVHAIEAMRSGTVKVFFGMGGNFASASPDTAVTEAGLAACELTVHVSTKPNRSHAVAGREALILPCLGRTEVDMRDGEQFVTVEDSMGIVHRSQGNLKPASPRLLSEVAIVCGVAEAVFGSADPIAWRQLSYNYDLIRDHIEAVIPGFHDYNARVRERDGFVLAHPPRDSREFKTPDGKAQLTVNELSVIDVPDGHLLLQTLRSHDQYNTTIYDLNDRYRGIKQQRRVVMINREDLVLLGFANGDLVDLVGLETDGAVRRAEGFRVVEYPTARGCAAAYFPETNVLVPLSSRADESNTPTSKSIVIRLEPAESSR